MKVSIIIPTHNRPEYLVDALNSAYQQDYQDLEIIVIDDGSVPAVDVEQLHGMFDKSIQVIRNPEALGIGNVREMASRVATGDLIWQLDDDDLLAKDAISACINVFNRNPCLDVLFVNIESFGHFAARRREQQDKALSKLFSHIHFSIKDGDVLLLNWELLQSLLHTVPQAFQHPVVRKSSSRRVYELFFRSQSAGSEMSGTRNTKQAIPDDLNEAEWAIYASALCRCALLQSRLYRMRSDDQGYFSVESNRQSQLLANVKLKQRLFENIDYLPELAPWRLSIRRAYSQTLLCCAYEADNSCEMLLKSFLIMPSWKALGMLIKFPLHLMKSASRKSVNLQ